VSVLPATPSPTEAVAPAIAEAHDPATVYRLWAPTVGRWAHQLAGPGADVEDVVQEVFLKVYQRFSAFRGECQISTWLFRITYNEVARRRRRTRVIRWLFGDPGDPDERALEVPSRVASPLEVLQRDQEVRGLYRALDQLKERDRTVLILFEIEGMRGEEIAQLMGVRVGTVWTWLHRARARLLGKLRPSEKGVE